MSILTASDSVAGVLTDVHATGNHGLSTFQKVQASPWETPGLFGWLSFQEDLEETRFAPNTRQSLLCLYTPTTWTEEPGGLQSMVSKSQTRLSNLTHTAQPS